MIIQTKMPAANAYSHYKMTLGRGHHRSADVMVALGRHYSRIKDDKNAV